MYAAITAILGTAPAKITATGHGIPNGWRAAVTAVAGMTAINAAGNPPKDNDYHDVTVIDTNTVTLNDVNAALSMFKPYISGGYLQYNTPQPLTGFTALMEIKSSTPATVYALQCMIAGTIGATAPVPTSAPSTTIFAYVSASWAVVPMTGTPPMWTALTAYTVGAVVTLDAGATLLETLTVANGKVVLDTVNMTITLTIPAATTAAYAWTSGIYDLKMTSATGVVTTILRGNVTVWDEVST